MEHTHETHTASHNNEVKNFYVFVGIIAFAIVVLQPLSMLAVMFINALVQM